jgi:hypothetical protein
MGLGRCAIFFLHFVLLFICYPVVQNQVVTCSGGANTGSVNIIRNGADFQELAAIPGLTDVTNIWAVRDQFEDRYPTSCVSVCICF